jgi:Mrp family chromosome partitioning ATPase
MSAHPASIHMDAQDFAEPHLIPLVSASDSPAAAAFRQLRHRLHLLHDARVIAVSSADPGEGKTRCAVNLAMAIAEQGRDSVLLVEANLQRPSFAELLGFSPPVCFARQMMSTLEGSNRKWRAVSAFFPKLHVLAIDPETDQTGPLNAAAFSETMLQLKALGHRYIVIDCPPVLGSADVNIIEDVADGVLLTLKKGKSKRSRVRKAVSHLEPVTILGTVLVS